MTTILWCSIIQLQSINKLFHFINFQFLKKDEKSC
nr:MAG TPA: hypothetical protein [Bacteriophage sp.]